MEHVFRLVEETQLGFTKKWKGGAIFIDVEKAFERAHSMSGFPSSRMTWEAGQCQMGKGKAIKSFKTY